MPRVPTYDGNQVRTTALNPVQQRTPDVSSGLMAASRALGQVADAADQVVMRDAQARADKIDTEITAGWLQWDAENRPKFQGENASQYEVEAKAWWDKARETYGQNADPLVLRQIGSTIGRKQTQAMGNVFGYVSQEKERFADQSAEASAQTSIEFGIDNGDPAGAAARIRQISAQTGARKGWTTEQVQADQQRLLGTLHLAYVTRLADTNPEAATRYFEANKQEIPAQAQIRVEEVLTRERDNQFALKFAADNAGAPLDEQLRKAGEIADPTRREKTIQQIRVNQGLVKAAQQEREAAASDQAWQTVAQGRKVPEAVLGAMNGRERVQLNDYLRQRAEHLATQGNKPAKTDPATLAKVYDMARDNPDEFKQLRMDSLTYKLSGSDLEQVARLQRDMREPAKEKDAISVSMQIGSYTRGMNTNDRALFESAAQSEIIRFQEDNKRPPTSKERQQMLDNLKLEGTIQRDWWFDSTKPRYRMTPEEQARAAFTPAGAPSPATAGALPRVTSDADFNSLPKGTRFIAPDGTTRIKQ